MDANINHGHFWADDTVKPTLEDLPGARNGACSSRCFDAWPQHQQCPNVGFSSDWGSQGLALVIDPLKGLYARTVRTVYWHIFHALEPLTTLRDSKPSPQFPGHGFGFGQGVA